MGIVSSTFASLAIQLAWNCQRYLDPHYDRCLEDTGALETSSIQPEHSTNYKQQSMSTAVNKRNSAAHPSEIKGRNVRIRQRYRRRPASFDTALIANRSDNPSAMHVTCVVTSTPSIRHSPLPRSQPQFWDVTSSSGCSSDSGSQSEFDSDSDLDNRLNKAFIRRSDETENENELPMSANEEAALRITVGRGYFSKSKRDEFLNHLRLEKRLNYLNNTFCGTLQRGYGRGLRRRYSGDLYMV